VVNKPSRGVGGVTVDRVIAEAVAAGNGGGVTGAETEASAAGNGGGVTGAETGVGADTGAGDLAAAARRVMPDLSAKARAGLAFFLDAIEAGRRILNRTPAGDPPPDSRDNQDNREGRNRGKKRENRKAPDGKAEAASDRKREKLRAGEGLSPCLVALIAGTGIADYHLSHDEIGGNQRIANLQELVNAASIYPLGTEGLLEFLEHIELDRSLGTGADGETNTDAVTLITLHNTKGLEFRRVIITGVEQGIFPRDDKKGEDLEEERRLFYVGTTRAMDELYLCSCAMRRIFGRSQPMEPSLFLRETAGDGKKPLLRVLGNAPFGFRRTAQTAARPSFGGGFSGARTRGRRSSDGRWAVGDRLFHDDYGYGAVIEIRESGEDGPVVLVHFDTGKELRFLSACQSGHFTKTGDD
jgi:DNA helicase-2/ATP-dependent DNA helicase PcrA